MSQLKPREPLQLTPLEERITVTFVVTKECNFRCRYCYMVGKHGHGRMSFEIAKAAIDYLIEDRKSFPQSQMTWEFIGGEPLLEVDLIEKIIDYFTIRSFELDHPWFVNHMFSFSTNGSLYHTPKFQQLIKQYGKRLDVGLTLDGPAHVHDMERQFPDGRGTHETILKNLPLWLKNAPSPSTKVTIARSTLPYVAESMLYLFSVGMEVIHANVVFENVWQDGDEDVFEEQLDILGDAIIEQGWWRTHECSLFDRMIGKPLDMSHNQNWCGAGRYMLAVDSQGLFYPCVRFTDHSLVNQKPWVVGNVKDGLDYDALLPFNQLSRSSQSNQECMNCEVASGCAWCQGFNYDDSGDLFKRATYICKMHKARVRANERFWKKIDALIEAEGAPMEKASCCSVAPTDSPCGKVSPQERDEIKALFQRRLGLQELFQALAKMEPEVLNGIYEKAVTDMGETAQRFQKWWTTKAEEHKWESVQGGSWRIDFDTCEVFLVRPS